MFQAAAGMNKQQLSNMGTFQKTRTLPSTLAESMGLPSAGPFTQDAQENSESQSDLSSLTFKRRRIGKVEEIPDQCNSGKDKVKTDGGLLPSVHRMNDMEEVLGTSYMEELDQTNERCKRVNGKGWRCGNMNAPNSAYCQHHQTKLAKRYKKRNGKKARTGQPTNFVRDRNSLAVGHSMIDSNCSVQAPKDCDADNFERGLSGISMDDGVQDEVYKNGYHNEKKWVQHVRESGEIKKLRQMQHEGLQDHMEGWMPDTGVCYNRLHVKQLQEEQLRWWEYRQGGSDSTFTSQKAGSTGNEAEALLLPRRSERRLIIDVCKSTAAEHQQIEGKMGASLDHGYSPRRSNNISAASNTDELLQLCTSAEKVMVSKLQSSEMEPANMENAQELQGSEHRQCKRHDGRGWQCKRTCPQGQFYCEHHLSVMRKYVERIDAKSKGRLQRQGAMAAKHAGELRKLSPRLDEKSLSNEFGLQAVNVTERMNHMQHVCRGSCRAGNDRGRTAKDAARVVHGLSDTAGEQLKQVQQAGQGTRSGGDQLQPEKRGADQSQGQIESNEAVHKLEQVKVGMDQPLGLPKQRKQPAASQSYQGHKLQGVAGSACYQLPVAEQELNANGEQKLKVTKQELVLQEGQPRCGRHDGRGWRCKSLCKEGSLYCEYHREKLRRNHASWNAKKLQEKKALYNWSRQAAGERKEKAGAAVEEAERRVATLTVRGMKKVQLAKKRMRSLQDIEART